MTRKDCKRSNFQLLGITALFMAAKMEELDPQIVTKFAKYTLDLCSAHEICNKEKELATLLKWKLNPDTLYFWVEYYIRMWDQFAKLNGLSKNIQIKQKNVDSTLAAP